MAKGDEPQEPIALPASPSGNVPYLGDAVEAPTPLEQAPMEPDTPLIEGRDSFGLQDRTWKPEAWRALLEQLVDSKLVTWMDVTTSILGQLNPPQVGTSIASNKGFQKNLGGVEASVMRQVYDWLYDQMGKCIDCGSRLDLQADHVDSRKESIEDPTAVDRLDNLVLRCRRHNVIRRKSHKQGGKTYLTAEAALMWILLVIRPRTYKDFLRMARLYGMTMADVRMHEAWAMAVWLHKEPSITYDIDQGTEDYIVLRWPDNALTRQRISDPKPSTDARILGTFPAEYRASCLVGSSDGKSVTFVSQAVRDMPFSTYALGAWPPQALAVNVGQPKADETGALIALPLLPPRGREVLELRFHAPEQLLEAEVSDAVRRVRRVVVAPSGRPRKIALRPNDYVRLRDAESTTPPIPRA